MTEEKTTMGELLFETMRAFFQHTFAPNRAIEAEINFKIERLDTLDDMFTNLLDLKIAGAGEEGFVLRFSIYEEGDAVMFKLSNPDE